MEHAGMQGPFPHFSSPDMMLEYVVPKGKMSRFYKLLLSSLVSFIIMRIQLLSI
jgi:hypothetical protein